MKFKNVLTAEDKLHIDRVMKKIRLFSIYTKFFRQHCLMNLIKSRTLLFTSLFSKIIPYKVLRRGKSSMSLLSSELTQSIEIFRVMYPSATSPISNIDSN